MAADRALEVLDAGLLTLIQDLGRVGLASIGVGPSGAADRGAFRLGARLLAQSYTAAALEVTFGGLSVRARGDLQVALTGAQAPAAVDGRAVGYFGPFMVADGQILTLGTPQLGLRSYLSVRGGIAVAPVLGSRCNRHPVRSWDRLRCEQETCYPSVHPRRHFLTRILFQFQRGRRRPSFCMRSAARETTGSARWPPSPKRRGRCPTTAIGSGSGCRASPYDARAPGRGRSCPAREWSRGSIQVPPGGAACHFSGRSSGDRRISRCRCSPR